MSLIREVDLLPLWNPFVKHAAVLRLMAPGDLIAYGNADFWPMPLPSVFAMVHAVVRPAPGRIGLLISRADEQHGHLKPADAKGKIELPMYVRAEFTAERARAGRPRTCARGEMKVDLSRIVSGLGLALLPEWVIRLVIYFIVPTLWRGFLANVDRARGEESLWAQRVRADSSGLYATIRKSMTQPDV
jgi:hypothetical protein